MRPGHSGAKGHRVEGLPWQTIPTTSIQQMFPAQPPRRRPGNLRGWRVLLRLTAPSLPKTTRRGRPGSTGLSLRFTGGGWRSSPSSSSSWPLPWVAWSSSWWATATSGWAPMSSSSCCSPCGCCSPSSSWGCPSSASWSAPGACSSRVRVRLPWRRSCFSWRARRWGWRSSPLACPPLPRPSRTFPTSPPRRRARSTSTASTRARAEATMTRPRRDHDLLPLLRPQGPPRP